MSIYYVSYQADEEIEAETWEEAEKKMEELIKERTYYYRILDVMGNESEED